MVFFNIMPRRKWSAEMTKFLIVAYENQPVLYKVNEPDHHNKFLRHRALQTIKEELEEKFKEEFLENDILKKINNLRSQFLDHLKTQRKQPASGSETVVKPVWWLFSELQFLIPYCLKDRGKSNLNSTQNKYISQIQVMQDETDINAENQQLQESQDMLTQIKVEPAILNENEAEIVDIKAESQESHDLLLENKTYSADSAISDFMEDVATTPNEIVRKVHESSVGEILTSKHRRKRKRSMESNTAQSVSGSDNYAEIVKGAIEKIVNPMSAAEDLITKDKKNFAAFLETQFLQIENKKVYQKLKWDLLSVVRSAMKEDQDNMDF